MMKTRILLAAALLAISSVASAASGDATAGQKKAANKGCPACHGDNGISVSPEFPNLAGQYPDYIATALRHYQNGKRKNPIMAAQVKELDAKDILDLAAFFSSQHGLAVKH
jgi:cytochrome c553